MMMMSSLEIALIILGIVFGGAVVGLLIGRRLPDHHMSTETRAVVSVSMAVVGTMSALVIGFLISNASTAFTERNGAVAHLSSDIVRLDALLRRYGPDTEPTREVLQRYATTKYDDLFASGADKRPNVDNPATVKLLDEVQDRILVLKPDDDHHRWLSTQALQLASEMSDALSLLVQHNQSTLPIPFVGAVVLWLTVLFVSFGLFAPRNATTLIALFFCAFAVSAAIKLVLDLDTPLEGKIRISPPPIHISSDPLRHAVEVIRR